jgi:hypothetical protein
VTAWRRWALAWLGGAVIGTANGIARELTYRKRIGELRAHQLSSVTAVSLFSAYFTALERRWPIATRRDALRIGLTWLVLTVAFELGVGRLVAKGRGPSCWPTTTSHAAGSGASCWPGWRSGPSRSARP